MSNDKMLSRIAALLRQAEGTDNMHEAEAFSAIVAQVKAALPEGARVAA